VLYVREDRLLAFEGALAWESGSVKDTGVPMVQFRGRGLIALEVPRDPIAVEVGGDAQTLVSAARLYGWVGRLVPHAAVSAGLRRRGDRFAGGRRLAVPSSLRRELTNLPNLVTMSRVVLIPFVL